MSISFSMAFVIKICIISEKEIQRKDGRHNVTLRRFLATNFAVEKQYVLRS